jgi:hypothetical protein
VLVLALFLLIAHSLSLGFIKVDGVTLALLGVLMAIPLIEYVRKIRIGEFEAEIAPREVAQAEATVEDQLDPKTLEEPDDEAAFMIELTQRDPQLGLASVRIKLEQALRDLYHVANPGQRMPPLARTVDDLAEREVLEPWLAAGIRDVLPLANRAVHGEHIRASDAQSLVSLGIALVAEVHAAFDDLVEQTGDEPPLAPGA